MSISVLITSRGRTTLNHTITSVTGQMQHGDELLVGRHNRSQYGVLERNRLMRVAKPENTLVFMDDDDWFTPNALELVRAVTYAHPLSVHIFSMRYHSGRLFDATDPQLITEPGHIGSPMIVPPAGLVQTHDCRHGDGQTGDYSFACQLHQVCEREGYGWRTHADVIAEIGRH